MTIIIIITSERETETDTNTHSKFIGRKRENTSHSKSMNRIMVSYL